MFITLEADYAVRIVSVLCREKDKWTQKPFPMMPALHFDLR